MADNILRDVLLEVIRVITPVGIDSVRVKQEDGKVTFETLDEEKSIIISGELLSGVTVPEFEGVGSFGISKVGVLGGFLNLATHKTDKATIKINARERNGVMTAEEIELMAEKNVKTIFRLMNPELLPKAKFKDGVKWDVVFSPDKSTMAEFNQKAAILGSFEDYFYPTVDEAGNLIFCIGAEGNHSTFTIMAEGVTGKLSQKIYIPTVKFTNALKVDSNLENTVCSIFSGGALMLETKLAKTSWRMILPARIKS
jgi:hypothetical protein